MQLHRMPQRVKTEKNPQTGKEIKIAAKNSKPANGISERLRHKNRAKTAGSKKRDEHNKLKRQHEKFQVRQQYGQTKGQKRNK